jgi:chromosome segregation and condensation protein ScpB
MSSEPLKVKDFAESLKDSDAKSYQERLIEDLERSDVSDHGIHLESNGLLLEPVKWDIIIELR